MTKIRYQSNDISIIRRLRQRYKPHQIAEMTGRTINAIKVVLSREKAKGADFPKLKHGSRKYDKIKAQEWRGMIRNSMKYKQIQELHHVQPAVISRILAAEARGELNW